MLNLVVVVGKASTLLFLHYVVDESIDLLRSLVPVSCVFTCFSWFHFIFLCFIRLIVVFDSFAIWSRQATSTIIIFYCRRVTHPTKDKVPQAQFEIWLAHDAQHWISVRDVPSIFVCIWETLCQIALHNNLHGLNAYQFVSVARIVSTSLHWMSQHTLPWCFLLSAVVLFTTYSFLVAWVDGLLICFATVANW